MPGVLWIILGPAVLLEGWFALKQDREPFDPTIKRCIPSSSTSRAPTDLPNRDLGSPTLSGGYLFIRESSRYARCHRQRRHDLLLDKQDEELFGWGVSALGTLSPSCSEDTRSSKVSGYRHGRRRGSEVRSHEGISCFVMIRERA